MPELAPLQPGPLNLAGGAVEIVAYRGRVGDGLVYVGRADGRTVRIREYAPADIVTRLPDGALAPADPRFGAAWEDAALRFLRQGERLARLDHFAVAPIHRAVRSAGATPFTVGAPLGETLAEALAGGLVLSPRQVMRLAADLADALAVLHASEIVHLDIAPATVSLAAGWLELADFAIDNRRFLPLTGGQEGLVRPGYSPIEQSDASMADPLGTRADVHAASALLHRLIAGRDPAPWQVRWRDPAAGQLPDNNDYPRAFREAIRRGMAVEPGDRFADGTAWRDALALPPSGEALGGDGLGGAAAIPPRRGPSPAPPPSPDWSPPLLPSPVTEPHARRRPRLLPAMILAALAGLLLLGYLAYTQRWFAPKPKAAEAGAARDSAPGPNSGKAAEPPPPPPPANEVPLVRIGGTAAGRLEEGDRMRGSGQFEDRYALDALGGEKIVIRLSSPDFDPLLALNGPDLAETNDDAGDDVRDSRIVAVLPRSGRYFLSVSSYDRGESGTYTLEIERAGVTEGEAEPQP